MKRDLHGYIGVFDSGVGGVSVLKQLIEECPNEKYYYYGDSLFAPYGEKSIKEIQDRTIEIINRMVNNGVKAIVIACNTATSAAVSIIRNVYDIPIIGIEPALKPAVKDGYQNVMVMATSNTLKLDKYQQLSKTYSTNINVIEVGCVGLAKAIEKGDVHSDEIKEILHRYLDEHVGKIDAVVLGCTHYPFVKEEIKNILGDVAIYDGAIGASKQLKRQLIKNNLENTGEGEVIFDTSKDEEELSIYQKLLEL